MVVQKDNWHEMPLMLDLAYKYNADRIYFNKIQNWNTALDFSQQQFIDNKQFKEIYSKINKDPKSRVWALV